MSPEQCRDSSDVDLRSDIYSFAIIVHEMLAGVPPFASQSAAEMLVLQITADPPPLRQYLPELPEYVEQTVMRALAKDREMRFGSVDYFVGALHGTYPALTAPGSSTSPVGPPDRAPGRSLYSTQGFGYQKTPPPVLLGNFGSRRNLTPVPVPVPSQTITTLSHATGETTLPSQAFASESELEAIKPRRWPLVLGACAVAAAAALFFAFRASGPSAAGPVPQAPAVSAKQAPAVPAVAEPVTVRLQIRSSPAGASVLDAKDGTVLGVTPLEKSYPQGSGTLGLLLRLQGYKDKTVAVGLEGNSATSVDLERVEISAAEGGQKPAPPTTGPRKQGGVRKPPKTTRTTQNKEDEWRVH